MNSFVGRCLSALRGLAGRRHEGTSGADLPSPAPVEEPPAAAEVQEPEPIAPQGIEPAETAPSVPAFESLGTFVPLFLADIEAAQRDAAIPAERLLSHENVIVEIPPIVVGREVLATARIHENVPFQPWNATSYEGYAASAWSIRGSIVHGAVGITTLGDRVLAETLWHTAPERHRYTRDGEAVTLLGTGVERLAGTHVSILVGAAESYWHSLIEATARLILIPDDILATVTSVLIPSTGIRQRELIDLYGLPANVDIRVVTPDETFEVETLIYPSTLHFLFIYSPLLLNAFFDRLVQRLPPVSIRGPRRIYIDRRGAPLRRLLNEEALIDAVRAIGFAVVKLEDLGIVEQVRLFHEADMIVAPHGAGLTNIGFSRPGTIVLELMMDTYLMWCFRRIAAFRDLRYDCLIGQSSNYDEVIHDSVHLQVWTVDVAAVLATIDMMDRSETAPAAG